MKIPIIEGIIERRILANYTVEKEIVQKILPSPFRPKLYNGKAIAGICLIRLKKIRPKGLPAFVGISSENGAHRFAVEWTEGKQIKEGVFIPRRDTSSLINSLAGGRIFPGLHFYTKFIIKEKEKHFHIAFKSSDGTSIFIDADEAEMFNPDSIFKSLGNASGFFEAGALGYSPDGDVFEGLKLTIDNWKVKPLNVKSIRSSFFDNENIFPKGSIQFDNALLMTGVKHEWHYAGKKNGCPDKINYKITAGY